MIEPFRREDVETRCLAWIDVLFDRYGVLARETLMLDLGRPPGLTCCLIWPAWNFAERSDAGTLWRGFPACNTPPRKRPPGWPGARRRRTISICRMFSSPPQTRRISTVRAVRLTFLCSKEGPLRLSRVAGNYLVLRGGRPILILEAYGKRLTGLASSSAAEIDSPRFGVLDLVSPDRRVFKVESYNGQPSLASTAAARLAELGFVRDYPAMTYYAAWSSNGV